MTSEIKILPLIFLQRYSVFRKWFDVFLKLMATLIVCLFIFQSQSMAQSPCKDWVARVVSVEGTVEILRGGEKTWRIVNPDEILCEDDIIRVQERSRAAIVTSDNSLFRLDQKTTLFFSKFEKEKPFILRLIDGAVHFFSRSPRGLQVNTPFVNAVVGGTEFYVRVAKNEVFLTVFEGRVSAVNDLGTLALSDGQSTIVHAGKAPLMQVVLNPRDAVRWALYYPPILDYRPGDFDVINPKSYHVMVKNSLEHYWKGDITAAFFSLKDLPQDLLDPRPYIYRAALFLSVGRVDEAASDIHRALEIDSVNADAIALQSIVALVQNNGEKAFQLASEAVNSNPESSVARIALSYAQQARFYLKSALKSLMEAVSLSPENERAHARLAELYLSLGDLDNALSAANRAVELNPRLARTQTVLGFAHLSQIRLKEAMEAFEKAIAYDQADPMPRLGLGLAKIREGDLEEGRRQIEIAVILDPNNSLVRSYLGKAYFDEKRSKSAKEQFLIAKQLDPADPTPYFYDAILKQTENLPVEALEDLQKSIELNDNRAVYRSRLQLDQDLAARSASLARLYQDLGFDKLALVEGWKSVNTDPGNHSAHRFLADSYSALPRHEIARVSELLQSQLMQPLNLNPVQPSLAESSFPFLDGAGPANTAFNEFNPLFNRNRLALNLSGISGSNDTLGGEIVMSGVWGKISYSLGAFNYETDGFRENNDQEQDLYNAFFQVMPWYQTSLLAEFRSNDSKFGDLSLRFNPEFFFPNDRYEEDADSLRLGLRHSFSPGSDLIATVITKNNDAKYMNAPALFEFDVEDDGYMAEAQHLFKSDRFNLITGTSYLRSDRKLKVIFLGPFPTSKREDTVTDMDFYVYSQFSIPEKVHWTLGASVNLFEGIENKDQFNPKLGVMWDPLPATTIRAAAFRVLTRNLISDQTIEPTQVAGFNQFFDDLENNEAWRYGVAIEQKFSPNIFGGLEMSKRDLNVNFRNQFGEWDDADWTEKLARAYLYWAPISWLSLNAEYMLEKFDRDLKFTGEELVENLHTHRFKIGINLYCSKGFTFKFSTTYVDQEGDFDPDPTSFISEDGEDHFWVADALLSYRLPKRYGLISLEVKNLFDEGFSFQEMGRNGPEKFPERFQDHFYPFPERFIALKMNFAF